MRIIGIPEKVFNDFLIELQDGVNNKIDEMTDEQDIRVLESYLDAIKRVVEFINDNAALFHGSAGVAANLLGRGN